MQYPVTVAGASKPAFSIPSIWNLLRSFKDRNSFGTPGGHLALMLPVRIECASPLESWLVQHRLFEMGADWEQNLIRLPRLRRNRERCSPWNMRACLHLVVKFSAEFGAERKPCLDWVTQEEFEAMEIPKTSGESILLDYRHIMPHREVEPC